MSPSRPARIGPARLHLGWAISFVFTCTLALAWALKRVAIFSAPGFILFILVIAPALPFMHPLASLGLTSGDFIRFPSPVIVLALLALETSAVWAAGWAWSRATHRSVPRPFATRPRAFLAIWFAPFLVIAMTSALELFLVREMARRETNQIASIPPPPTPIERLSVQPRPDGSGADVEAVVRRAPADLDGSGTHDQAVIRRADDVLELIVTDGMSRDPVFREERRLERGPGSQSQERWWIPYGPMFARWRRTATKSDTSQTIRGEFNFRVELVLRSSGANPRIADDRFAVMPLHFESRPDGFAILPPTEHTLRSGP